MSNFVDLKVSGSESKRKKKLSRWLAAHFSLLLSRHRLINRLNFKLLSTHSRKSPTSNRKKKLLKSTEEENNKSEREKIAKKFFFFTTLRNQILLSCTSWWWRGWASLWIGNIENIGRAENSRTCDSTKFSISRKLRRLDCFVRMRKLVALLQWRRR